MKKKQAKKKQKKNLIWIAIFFLIAFVLFCAVFIFVSQMNVQYNPESKNEITTVNVLEVMNSLRGKLTPEKPIVLSVNNLELTKEDNQPVYVVYYNPSEKDQTVSFCKDCGISCNKIFSSKTHLTDDSIHYFFYANETNMTSEQVKAIRIEVETLNATKGDYLSQICMKYSEGFVAREELKIRVE